MFAFSRNKDAVHIMVDLETLGKAPGSAIIQIGACKFTPEKGIIGEYERSIDMKSSIDHGFKVEGDTIAWWFDQGDAARKSVVTKTFPVRKAIEEFSKFVGDHQNILWTHKDFDLSILKEAYRMVNMPFPVHYRNMCDLRTLDKIAHMCRIETELKKDDGVSHTAGYDSRYQARVAAEYLMTLVRMSSVYHKTTKQVL